MIEGLKVRVPGAEMKAKLKERADHHFERCQYYTDRIKAEEADPESHQQAQVSGGSPLQQYRQKLQGHLAKHDHFKFMTEHAVVEEIYELSEADLVFMEIITQRW